MKDKFITILKTLFGMMVSIILLSWAITIVFGEKVSNNDVPDYFLEPEGCVIAKVYVNTDFDLFSKFNYGYITEEDFKSYLDGTLTGILVIRHPYKEDRTTNIQASNIKSMEVGLYKDYRGMD